MYAEVCRCEEHGVQYAVLFGCPQCSTELERLRVEIAKLRALLKSLEWKGEKQRIEYCPVCEMSRSGGHEPGCELAAALR